MDAPVLLWKPPSALDDHVEHVIRQWTADLSDERAIAIKKASASVAARGLLRSGAHLHALLDSETQLLRERTLQLLTRLLQDVERFDVLTDESGAWVLARITKVVSELQQGITTGLLQTLERLAPQAALEVIPPKVADAARRTLGRAGLDVSSAVAAARASHASTASKGTWVRTCFTFSGLATVLAMFFAVAVAFWPQHPMLSWVLQSNASALFTFVSATAGVLLAITVALGLVDAQQTKHR